MRHKRHNHPIRLPIGRLLRLRGLHLSPDTDSGAGGGTTVADPPAPDAPLAPPTPPVEKPVEQPAKPADTPTPDEKKTPADGKPAEIAYDLKLPEGSTLDAGLLERTAAIARARGLSNEQAQAALDLVQQEVASHTDATLKAYQPGGAEYEKQIAAWKAEALADPTLGATEEERRATVMRGRSILQKFADANPEDAPRLKEFLSDTGLGEHPVLARFFGWLGKATSESRMVMPASTSAGEPSEREALQHMFPNSPELFTRTTS